MKIADILRQLADTIEAEEAGQPDPRIQNPAVLVPAEQEVEIAVDEKPSPNGTTESGNDKDPEGVFLPPLQQKQELLKKAVGVENIYDDGTAVDQAEQEHEPLTSEEEDELEKIKRAAGIPVAAVIELSNDGPLDD